MEVQWVRIMRTGRNGRGCGILGDGILWEKKQFFEE